MPRKKETKKQPRFIRMTEVKYRKMRRDRERLLKVKALLRLASNYLANVD